MNIFIRCRCNIEISLCFTQFYLLVAGNIKIYLFQFKKCEKTLSLSPSKGKNDNKCSTIILLKQVGFGRAARTRLFRLINTQNGALRPPSSIAALIP
jgi:hypothetical protein